MSHQLSFLFDALRAVDTDQKITPPSRLYSSDTLVLKAVDTDQKIALSLTQSSVSHEVIEPGLKGHLIGYKTSTPSPLCQVVSLRNSIMKLVGILILGLFSGQGWSLPGK